MGTKYTYQAKGVPVLKACTPTERVHFKPMFETGRAIKGMKVSKALSYLEAVIEHKRAVPFFRYNEGIPHHAQGKEWGCPSSRWPEKSAKLFIKLIKNALAGASQKPEINVDNLVIAHVQCNYARMYRYRRIHQAHGRVKCYASPPTNVQIVLAEEKKPVKAAA
ncbi:ribosomal protein L22 [Histomonas meleagridis]|uniref:ribosomal protein L22 n=1 Tax=Histomonas meleagridis TaxID=135588 RepID=UPI003559537E|nr:ribosomal protein L22 [Histomonas meleagridis]KAH0804738.1 ribosomal protein L22 [Histomonas meleagridis]